jgi:hypothetical protein
MTYDTRAIAQAAFEAADEIQARYQLESSDRSMMDLLINLTLSRLETPDITVEQAIRDNWNEEPEVIDGWINDEEDSDGYDEWRGSFAEESARRQAIREAGSVSS